METVLDKEKGEARFTLVFFILSYLFIFKKKFKSLFILPLRIYAFSFTFKDMLNKCCISSYRFTPIRSHRSKIEKTFPIFFNLFLI